MSPPVVLVTDGNQRASLAITRSLGAAGYRVIVAAAGGRSLAGASRFAAGRISLPAPDAAPERFAAEVVAALRAHSVDVLLPVTEASLLALLPDEGGSLEGVPIAGPRRAAFEAIRDKAGLLERAAGLDVPVPPQLTAHSPEDAPAAPDITGFPVVLKPARSVISTADGMRTVGVRYAGSADALAAALAELPLEAYPVLLQRYIEGPGVGIFGLLWDGQRRATFAHRRIREKPPSGGVSVCSESVAAPPALVEASFRLLESYDWQGVAMVEYKQDADGKAWLMEVNGRFWGSLQLAIHAGVDFPRLLVENVLGSSAAGKPEYRIGVRNHWEWGEVDHARLRRRDSPRPALLRLIRELFDLRPGRDRCEVFRARDPRPFARETIDWLRGVA